MNSGRPKNLSELKATLAKLVSPEAFKRGLALQLKPSDLVISPFAKCGTTWLQQIVHTLRTRGDMDFDDISRVIPWIEVSGDLGLDLDAPQRAAPRAFKSHLGWDLVPKGGRYLVSLRDPRDALISAFRFMEGWFFETGSIAIEDWAQTRISEPDKGYWGHLRSWWSQRDNPDVLLLSFEDMKEDLAASIPRIAAFAGIALDPELETLTNEHASLAFMKAHNDRFDDRLMRERSEHMAGLPPGSDSSKVREGRVGDHRVELPDTLRDELDAIWRQEITPTLGFESYEALRRAL